LSTAVGWSGGEVDQRTAVPCLPKDATMATPATTEVKKDPFLLLVLSDALGLVG